mgnify:CR=1 FL=1
MIGRLLEASQEEIDATIKAAELSIDGAKEKEKASKIALKNTMKKAKEKIKAAKSQPVDEGHEGYTFGTWTDAYAYYLGASYMLNDQHKFQFYALGAPQRHGQNLYKQNVGAYDADFAKSIDGYDAEAVGEDGEFVDVGRFFNQNWSPVSSDYKGQQYWYM